MKTMNVPRSWLEENGRRLDGQPYLSGATEAAVLIRKLPGKPRTLGTVSKRIFHTGRVSRNFVSDPEFGVPFLGTVDIRLADLSMLPLISKRQVAGNDDLLVNEGWILITRSGTIGRMAYVRPELSGMACSEDLLRIEPNTDNINPGFLFSFLNSRFGLPMVIGMTYGAIIQHIEPHHITNLPIPRLGKVEDLTNSLCLEASFMRTQASQKLQLARDYINSVFSFPKKVSYKARNTSFTSVSSAKAVSRLEATHHDSVAQQSDRFIASVKSKEKLSVLANISETNRMREIFVEPEFGVPFLTSSDIFLLRYEPTRFISKKTVSEIVDWKVEEGNILLARSGQAGGIIGHGAWADYRFKDSLVSAHVLRIAAKTEEILPGYLFSYLCLSDVGYRQIVRNAAGSSVPFLDANDIRKLWIPRTDKDTEKAIDTLVFEAGRLRAKAQEKEDEARYLVENTIEELVNG